MTTRDLKITDGDLVMESGDLVLVSDGDAILQSVRVRLGFFRGEWFLDEEVGVPYFQRILVKNPSLAEVREWFRQTLVDTPGVLSVISLDVEYENTRHLTVRFRLDTDVGELASTEEVTI